MSDITKPAVYLPAPSSFEEAYRIAKVLAASELVPKDYREKPENCLVAMQWGSEIGLPALQALQNIAVINGRPSIWGDAAKALVLGHQSCDDIEEYVEGDGDAAVAVCIAKRRGRKPVEQRFSVADAKKAGLWGKSGPWQNYPKRMLQLRARGFALRDAFPDVLRGLVIAEEAQDYAPGEKNMGAAEVVASRPPPETAHAALQPYPDDKFDANLATWRGLINAGKRSADDIIATVASKHTLTDEQRRRIREGDVTDVQSTDVQSTDQPPFDTQE